ncbi:hypothetical protein DU52_03510 [Methanosarcina mazei]|uniref:Uncharacterized protein n=2 Tax=Methanosarcina mazei TaxID=2209 RepID=A0A0F8FCJ6_METMZ|nr:hypothetical protein MmTuc01_3029 [Methanosarcina mazei Tuc01]KKG31746.1 hypothetical protein DU49_09540 [Methanosarcina mazei]KKG37958.1 hypothetical protein DU52_03510 [Methanosarcina mazei]KKG40019.1 hypothetical protein DU35_01995 [Methanosarcina mazei]KKG40572.1 hypothetical protein DU39_09260 [Methanosarcina mazei]
MQPGYPVQTGKLNPLKNPALFVQTKNQYCIFGSVSVLRFLLENNYSGSGHCLQDGDFLTTIYIF